ncbi:MULTISPECIES: HEAT repeat domain-containing protein [Caproicibacterium]|uniref:HEAT repeat domain-containing protein n=1 Tax=Caproicibacterium argilliputei TaxID=3030016 RepID=A0AA97DA90_9FIRM|nr:HEAT repeat domain-containing protein [Caproicibacterium argilliputei]WOC32634.1 HEAT repeat domain-containing protein [Caproicibacterium argilliputei]
MADIEKLVEKKHWDKLKKKYLTGSQEERLELAKACGLVSADETVNMLVALMQDEDADVQVAAVESLGKVADDHTTAKLQLLLSQTPKENTRLAEAIREAVRQVRARQ